MLIHIEPRHQPPAPPARPLQQEFPGPFSRRWEKGVVPWVRGFLRGVHGEGGPSECLVTGMESPRSPCSAQRAGPRLDGKWPRLFPLSNAARSMVSHRLPPGVLPPGHPLGLQEKQQKAWSVGTSWTGHHVHCCSTTSAGPLTPQTLTAPSSRVYSEARPSQVLEQVSPGSGSTLLSAPGKSYPRHGKSVVTLGSGQVMGSFITGDSDSAQTPPF